LAQAEDWYSSHLPLLERCGLSSNGKFVKNSKESYVKIEDMSAAAEVARSSIALDLDEAMNLRKLLDKCTSWNERVALIAPKRNKRHNRGGRARFKLEDLIDLVEEASSLPIETDENVNRLQIQLNIVATWRSEASKKLQSINSGFNYLKSHVEEVYGEAKDYSIDRISDSSNDDEDSMSDECGEASNVELNKDAEEVFKRADSVGVKDNLPEVEYIVVSHEDDAIADRGSNSSVIVFRLIKEFKEGAKDIGVITVEGEIGDLLDSVSKWCVKSFKYLNTPRDVFDKRYFGAFDRFIVEGEDLCNQQSNYASYSDSSDSLTEQLFGAWGGIIKDQLLRLSILKREREKFEVWCKRATKILSDDKKLTAQKLADLAKTSQHFPASKFSHIYNRNFLFCHKISFLQYSSF